MAIVQDSIGKKLSSTSNTTPTLSRDDSLSSLHTLSRVNSIVSLPETDCGWPELEHHSDTTGHDTHAVLRQTYLAQPGTAQFVSGPPGQFATPRQIEPTFYQVAFQGGLEVRSGPFNAPLTGLVLKPDEVFEVSEGLAGMDGRVYLCLSDGRGWVFDDTQLMPQDPSVVRCSSYMGQDAAGPPYRMQPNAPAHLIPPPPAHSPQLLASVPPTTPTSFGTPASSSTAASGSWDSWFRVSYQGGIQLRNAPFIDAPLTGNVLPQNETFSVSEELPSPDGRVYLRLSDGRGWAFDDTAIMPHDPCVKRGGWKSPSPTHQLVLVPSSYFAGAEMHAMTTQPRRKYPQPRGKRGGKRASKRKNAALVSSGVQA